MSILITLVLIVSIFLLMALISRAVFHPPTKPYQCEACGGYFPKRKTVEVTEEYPEPHGGTSMTATFCKKDAP